MKIVGYYANECDWEKDGVFSLFETDIAVARQWHRQMLELGEKHADRNLFG